jgi:hypothetical protein
MRLKNIVSQLFGYVQVLVPVLVTQSFLASEDVSFRGIFRLLKEYFWAGFLLNMMSQLIGSMFWVPRVIEQSFQIDAVIGLILQFLSIFGMVVMIYFSFVFQVLVMRSQKGIACFTYSFRVVRGQWWRVLGVMLLCFLVALLPLYLLAAICMKACGVVDIPFGMSLAAPLFSVGIAFLGVFSAILFLNMDRQSLKVDCVVSDGGSGEVVS